MATKTPTKNGQSKTATRQQTPVPVPTVNAIKPVNVDERVKRITKLQDLSTQRSKLIKTKEELEKFQFGSDKLQDSLSIYDAHGTHFETSNSIFIAKITDHAKQLLDDKIMEVEQELIEADI